MEELCHRSSGWYSIGQVTYLFWKLSLQDHIWPTCINTGGSATALLMGQPEVALPIPAIHLRMTAWFSFLPLCSTTTHCLILAIMALWRAQATLITTPDGIGYATFGFRLFTPWENVEGRGTRIEVRSIGKGMSTNHVVSGLRLGQSAPVFQVRPWVPFMLAEIRDDPSCFSRIRIAHHSSRGAMLFSRTLSPTRFTQRCYRGEEVL